VKGLREEPKTLAFVLLLVATAAWGATFVVVKDIVANMQVLSFLAWRFAIAGVLLAVLRPRAVLALGRRGLARGALLGVALSGGYMAQTLGLRYTPAAISGFVTGLQVVFTPLLAWSLLRQRPALRAWVATLLATGGLAVMSLRGFSVGRGELLTLAASVLFALQIVGLGRWSSAGEAYGLATVQLLTVGACCLLAGLPNGPRPPGSLGTWAAVVATAVLATSFAFVAQTWSQSQLTTTQAAVVLTMEPVFAALVAWAAGEAIGWSVLVGGGLIVAAMLIVEVSASRAETAWTGRWWSRARRLGVRLDHVCLDDADLDNAPLDDA
jgi:drug/metabolite transporter (DMT)-like permease